MIAVKPFSLVLVKDIKDIFLQIWISQNTAIKRLKFSIFKIAAYIKGKYDKSRPKLKCFMFLWDFSWSCYINAFFFSKININLLISVYLLLDLKPVLQTQFHDAGQYTTD